LRLLRALGDIAVTTEDSAYRKMLLERGRRVLQGCSAQIGDENLNPLRARLTALEQLTTA